MKKFKKRLICLTIFITLILTFFIDSVSAQADSFYIGNFSNEGLPVNHVSSNNMVVDSDEDYWIVTFNDTTPYNFTFWRSTDKGDTWSSSVEFDMSNDYNEQPDWIAICVDDDNIIHIAYTYGWNDGVNTMYNISYRNYNTDTDTISSRTHVDSSLDLNIDHWIYGLSISVNDDGEIFLVWSEFEEGNDCDVFCRTYNDQIHGWGNEHSIISHSSGGQAWYKGISSDVLSNGTFIISAIFYKEANYNEYRIWGYDDETDNSYNIYSDQDATETSTTDYSDVAVDGNDEVHFVYEWDNGNKINYTYCTDGSTDATSYNETLTEQTDSERPQVSINTDETVQIVFIGDNAQTPSNYVMGYYGSYNDWSDLNFYQSYATDNTERVFTAYQNLQEFTHLTDGVVGYFVNASNDYAYHFDEGYELFYSEGGQQEGDVSSYDYRCSGGTFQNHGTLITQNISSYINSFGDITIKAFELGVGNGQTVNINDDPDDYLLWINGVSCGGADYIFQQDAFFSTVQWMNLDVNVSDNDIIVEIQQTDYSAVPVGYWYNLPLYSEDVGRYGGDASDGIFSGTLFPNNYGLGTCIYYDANVPAVSDNTYTLTLLSTDPHWRGNTTSVRVEVNGSEPWMWLVHDADGTIRGNKEYYPTGDNTFTVYWYVQTIEPTNEHTFYVLDQDSYPTGVLTSTNLSFNVSAYGGDVGNWSITAMHNPIELGEKQGYTFIVPLGYNYRVVIENMDIQNMVTLRDGIGTGTLKDMYNAYTIDRAGEWRVILFNTTDVSNPLYWNQYSDYFLCVPSMADYIYIIEDELEICYTSNTNIQGFYSGEYGVIHVDHPSNNSWSKQYPIEYGIFDKEFYPSPVEEAVGDYRVYIANIDGDVLSWSDVYTISVKDCFIIEDDEPILPELDETLKGVVAIMVIGFFTLIPMFFSLGMKQGTNLQIKIPSVAYVLFAGIGVSLCIIMDLIGTWILFFLIALGIIVIGGLYLINSRGGGSEG